MSTLFYGSFSWDVIEKKFGDVIAFSSTKGKGAIFVFLLSRKKELNNSLLCRKNIHFGDCYFEEMAPSLFYVRLQKVSLENEW